MDFIDAELFIEGAILSEEKVIPHLDSLLHHILDYVLLQEFNQDLIEPVGGALLSLMILRYDTYMTLVHEVMKTQSMPQIRERLEAAFVELNASVSKITSSFPNGRFNGNFEKTANKWFIVTLSQFLMNVRGILRVR